MVWLYLGLDSLSYGMSLFLLASGLTMIFGLMRIINLAHGSYYLLGSYLGIYLYRLSGSFVLAALGASLAVSAIGIGMERFLLRRLRHEVLAQVLLTFGSLFVFADVALWIWGGTPLFMDKPAALAFSFHLGDRTYPAYRIFLIATGLALALFLWWLQDATRLGASIRAAVDDDLMASCIGIRVPQLRIVVFGFGALLAGFGGVVAGPLVGAYPGADLDVLLSSFVIVVIGGLGSLKGAFVGSLIVGFIDTFTKSLLPDFAMFSVFAPMAILLAFRPTGLFGSTASGQTSNIEDQPRVSIFEPSSQGRRGVVLVALGLATALAIAWPMLVPGFFVTLLTTAFIWALAAFGLNLIQGFAGLPSLGHAAFFGLAAYLAGILTVRASVSMPTAILAATAAAAVLAALFGLAVLRTRDAYFMLLTMALALMVWAIAFKWHEVTGGDDGLRGIVRADAWGVPFSSRVGFFYLCGGLLGTTVGLVTLLLKTAFGYALVGARDNERRMAALGYNVWQYQYLAWIMSGTITGLAGTLFAFHNGLVNPSAVSVVSSANMLIMVILGGSSTLLGPVVGALAITFLENLTSTLTERWLLVLGTIYILVVLLAPNGVMGWLRRKEATTP